MESNQVRAALRASFLFEVEKKRHMGIKMRFFCQFYSINPLSIKLNYNSTSPKMAHDLQGKTALNV